MELVVARLGEARRGKARQGKVFKLNKEIIARRFIIRRLL